MEHKYRTASEHPILMNILPSLIKSHHFLTSKSCYFHIRELCCVWPYLNSKTASIALLSSCQH